jgi:hypothetical protein
VRQNEIKEVSSTDENSKNDIDDTDLQNMNPKMQGSLEFSMQDSTSNIFDDLIMKKLKKSVNEGEIEMMKEDHLYFTIQRISDEILSQFSSLKSVSSQMGIQNHIAKIIKKLKTKKQSFNKLFDFKDPNEEKKTISDYKALESILIKNYEKSSHEIKNIREKMSMLNKYLHDSKLEIKAKFHELEYLRKRISEIEDKPDIVNQKPGSGIHGKRSTNAGVVEEYLKTQKVKGELKKQEGQVAQSVTELEANIKRGCAEMEVFEADMRAAKNSKAYTKLELKQMYLKLLKDDGDLM